MFIGKEERTWYVEPVVDPPAQPLPVAAPTTEPLPDRSDALPEPART
jgi:hypothetical protein